MQSLKYKLFRKTNSDGFFVLRHKVGKTASVYINKICITMGRPGGNVVK